MNKSSFDQEMIEAMQQYLRINTAHPDPDYTSAINFFRQQAQVDGLLFEEIPLSSNRSAFSISLEGKEPTLPSLALNHHMDTVCAEPYDAWIAPPFSGTIVDGSFIGRGVQDMKSFGIIHYFALKTLKGENIIPTRTVHMIGVPDEEIGGYSGTAQLLHNEKFNTLNIGFVIDETRTSDLGTINIKVDERKPIQIRVCAQGSMDHGSRLTSNNAIHQLVKLLHRFVLLHESEQQKLGHSAPGLLLSCNITSLQAGACSEGNKGLNVIPPHAQATIDIRVPPCMPLSAAHTIINDIMLSIPHCSYTIEATVDERPFTDRSSCSLVKLARSAALAHGLATNILYDEGASDLRFYHAAGIEGIGFAPFRAKDMIHAINEALPIQELVHGKEIMVTLLKNLDQLI